jgi:hypothetical protein
MVEALEKVEIPPPVAPAEFPPPIFAGSSSVLVFLLRSPRVVLYIQVIRSDKVRVQKNKANQTSEEGKGMGDTPTPTGRTTRPLLALLALLVRSK